MRKAHVFLVILVSLLSIIAVSLAFQPIPKQDFCVADIRSGKLTGKCKDPSTVTVNDFSVSGLHLPGNVSNPTGFLLNFVNVEKMPGLYTQDIAFGRVDYGPNGFVPPHLHPKGTELITVLEGTLEVGFVTSYPSFKHYRKVLNKGDVFVVPVGLVHYQRNVGKGNVVTLFASNSENLGLIPIPNSIFGPKPDIDPDFLAAAFQLDKKTILALQQKF